MTVEEAAHGSSLTAHSSQQTELVRQKDEQEGEDEEGRQPGVFAHRALAVFAHNVSKDIEPRAANASATTGSEPPAVAGGVNINGLLIDESVAVINQQASFVTSTRYRGWF